MAYNEEVLTFNICSKIAHIYEEIILYKLELMKKEIEEERVKQIESEIFELIEKMKELA